MTHGDNICSLTCSEFFLFKCLSTFPNFQWFYSTSHMSPGHIRISCVFFQNLSPAHSQPRADAMLGPVPPDSCPMFMNPPPAEGSWEAGCAGDAQESSGEPLGSTLCSSCPSQLPNKTNASNRETSAPSSQCGTLLPGPSHTLPLPHLFLFSSPSIPTSVCNFSQFLSLTPILGFEQS